MKKILIISDTHGDISKLNDILMKHKDINYMIHAGDTWMIRNYQINTLDLDFIGVRGNVDFDFYDSHDETFQLFDKRFFLTHGHKYNVKSSINNLYYKALEEKADIVIFGHTHIPVTSEQDDLLIINPGSLSRPRRKSKGSYGILILDDGRIKYNLYYI